MATQIEKFIFKKFKGIDRNYNKKYRELLAAIRHPENAKLRSALIQERCGARAFTGLSSKKLWPKSVKHYVTTNREVLYNPSNIVKNEQIP